MWLVLVHLNSLMFIMLQFGVYVVGYTMACRAGVNEFHLPQHLQLSLVSQNDHYFVLVLSRWRHNLLVYGKDATDHYRGSLIVMKPIVSTKFSQGSEPFLP